jgi:hypothetical protein
MPLMKDQMAGQSVSAASLITMPSSMVASGRGSPMDLACQSRPGMVAAGSLRDTGGLDR